MRKTLAMLLVLSMLLSMIPAVFAAETGMTAAEAEAAVEKLNAGSDFYYELVEDYGDSDIEYRTEVRWWLAEGGHTDETLLEEVQAMYDAGFRGVELCQLNVSGMDETQWGLGSEQWNHDFHVVVNRALDLGMSVGITSGTNWNTTNVPGLDPDSQAAMQCLLEANETVAAGATRTGAIPLASNLRGKAQFLGAYAYPNAAAKITADNRYIQTTEMPSNPTTFTIDLDFVLENHCAGFCLGMKDTENFIMWQINNGRSYSGKIYCRPHHRINGAWKDTKNYDVTSAIGHTTATLPGSTVHMKLEVTDGTTVKTYFNGSTTAACTYTVPSSWGTLSLNKLGFRQDIGGSADAEEIARFDNIVVKDADGKVIYENKFDDPENIGFAGPGVKVVDGMLRVGLDQVEVTEGLEADAFIDLTDKVVVNADGRTGTLEWTAPADKNYTIFYLWSQGTAQRSRPASKPAYCVNYFDKRGFEAWTEFFSATVLSDPALNEKIIKGDVQLFMDSIEWNWGSGFTFWCEDFAEEFLARKGYDIRPYLILAKGLKGHVSTWTDNADYVRGTYELTDPARGQKIRNDLHDVQTELYMENLMIPMEQWLNQYNIDLRAQISYCKTPEISEPAMTVDFPEAENLNQRNQVDIYRLWSGASHLENKILSSETSATFGMQYAFSHQLHLQEAYALYAAGFSRINWHIWTSSWSPVSVSQKWPGFMSHGSCNVIGLREPGYAEYYELNQHLGRVQQLLREGKARADVGMLYVKYNQEMCCSVDSGSEAEDMWMQRHDTIFFPSTELQENGYTYDYFSHEFFNSDNVYYDAENGTLELAGYKALVLWHDWLALEGAEKLLELAKQGMKIVIVDGAAETSPYDEDDEALAAIVAELKTLPSVKVAPTADDVMECLQEMGVEPYAGFENEQLLSQVRETEDGNRYLFLYNYCGTNLHDGDDEEHGLVADTEVAVDGTFIPYEIDAWSGKVTQLGNYRWENGKTVFPVSVTYGDVALYAFEAVEEEPAHFVNTVRNDAVTSEAIKIEAEDCTMIHATREDRPSINTNKPYASGGKVVHYISSTGDGLILDALTQPINRLTVVYECCENGTLGIYVNDKYVKAMEMTHNDVWTLRKGVVEFETPLQPGDVISVKRSSGGPNIDCFYLEMVSDDAGTAYVSENGMFLRTTESGSYTTTLNDGTQATTEVTVPAAFDIKNWNLTVEEWTEGPEIFREDTQAGVVNREHTYSTVKTNHELTLDQLRTWDVIEEIGNGMSGRGYYSAKFNWDGQADGAYLDFGYLHNSMKVKINGVQTSDVNMMDPILDISDYLVEGENTIELVYSSTMTNEMLQLGRISKGQSSGGWDGYYKTNRSYGPSQAVVIPYVDTPVEESVRDVVLSLTASDKQTVHEDLVYTVSAEHMSDLANMILAIDLDEAHLENPVAEPAEGWNVVAQNWADGILYVAVINNAGADGAGDVLTIRATPNKQPGEITAQITDASLTVFTEDGEAYVPVIYENAKCGTVLLYSVYDVNHDGVVDQLDLTRAQRFYGSDHDDADVNNDGSVDIDDLILILNNFHEDFM